MAVKKRAVRINKIVVPTDFTPHSERAMAFAAALAQKFGASVTLIHVIESFTYSVTDTVQIIDHYAALKTIAEPLLEEMRKKLEKQKIKAKSVLTRGTPYDDIVRTARRNGADLIVMGTHGRTGVRHLLMGSVAERVLRLAHCAVLTVRG